MAVAQFRAVRWTDDGRAMAESSLKRRLAGRSAHASTARLALSPARDAGCWPDEARCLHGSTAPPGAHSTSSRRRRAPPAGGDRGRVRRRRGRAAGGARYNREEKFNLALFRRAGELGLLGLTVPEADGGAGLDATAAVIVHEALSTADPGFALAYLAHSVLFVNNFYRNASPAQRRRFLPDGDHRRVDRRHVHDRAGSRHRRARHAHDGAARRRPLRRSTAARPSSPTAPSTTRRSATCSSSTPRTGERSISTLRGREGHRRASRSASAARRSSACAPR